MFPKKSTRISDTVEFFPHGEELPTVTPIELVTHAALQPTKILKTPTPATQIVFITDENFAALQQLTHIFISTHQTKNS